MDNEISRVRELGEVIGYGHLIYKCLFHNGEIVGYEENYCDDYYFNKMLYKKKYHI